MSASGGNAPDEINSADNTKTTLSAKIMLGVLTAKAARLLFMRLQLKRPTSQTRSPTKIEGLHRVATWLWLISSLHATCAGELVPASWSS
jgi:hypothetical protein